MAALAAGTPSTAQRISEAQVPQVVRSAFATRFPAAEKVNWELEDPKTYEAEFILAGMKTSANFDATGEWQETEHGIAEAALPEAVRKTVNNRYPGQRPTGCEERDTPAGRFYEAEVKEGGKTVEVMLKADGTWVSSRSEEEEKDEEENDKD